MTVTNRTRARTNAHEKPEHRDAVLDRFYRANGGKKHDCGACEGDAARATNYDSRTRAVTATCDRHPDPKGRSLTRSATFSLQVRHLVCPLGAPPEARPGELSRWRRAGRGSPRVGRGLSRGNTRRSGTVGRGAPSAPLARRAQMKLPSPIAAGASPPSPRGFSSRSAFGSHCPGNAPSAPGGEGSIAKPSTRTPGRAGAGGVMEEGRAKTRKRRKARVRDAFQSEVSPFFYPKADSSQSRPFRLPFSFQPSQNFLARTEPSPLSRIYDGARTAPRVPVARGPGGAAGVAGPGRAERARPRRVPDRAPGVLGVAPEPAPARARPKRFPKRKRPSLLRRASTRTKSVCGARKRTRRRCCEGRGRRTRACVRSSARLSRLASQTRFPKQSPRARSPRTRRTRPSRRGIEKRKQKEQARMLLRCTERAALGLILTRRKAQIATCRREVKNEKADKALLAKAKREEMEKLAVAPPTETTNEASSPNRQTRERDAFDAREERDACEKNAMHRFSAARDDANDTRTRIANASRRLRPGGRRAPPGSLARVSRRGSVRDPAEFPTHPLRFRNRRGSVARLQGDDEDETRGRRKRLESRRADELPADARFASRPKACGSRRASS